MTLDLSLGEFTALTAKAFRGAGYPWGLADDGAYAARVLAQHQLPAAEIVARLLLRVERHGFADLAISSTPTDAMLCPVCLGAALSDLGESAIDQAPELIGTRPVLEPLLLAPSLTSGSIRWRNGHAYRSDRGIVAGGDLPSGPTAIIITRSDPTATKPVKPEVAAATRAIVGEASYRTLLTYAGRTYAPATDESRAAGAGESL